MDFLEEAPRSDGGHRDAAQPRGKPAAVEIEFDGVTKRYQGQDVPAIDNLTLKIPAGETCCLVGPSGGGKTTAMKLVNRLIELSAGDIRIGGRSVQALEVTALRRDIGYVIQQVGLFPHMTIAANLAVVPKLLGWSRDRIDRRVGELLDLVRQDGEVTPEFRAAAVPVLVPLYR
jgi:osmoprotectant transport system ATP-binding protein